MQGTYPSVRYVPSVLVPNVTKELIEEFCERGVSMVVFDFDDLSHDQCQSMVDEIRQGVFNYSLNKNHRVPYSLALVLDLKGPRIMTGTVFNSKVGFVLILLITKCEKKNVEKDVNFVLSGFICCVCVYVNF